MSENASRWLALGDIHDDIALFSRIPEADGADGLIVTGDITFNGGAAKALKALDPLAARVPRLLAQIGNMDRSDVNDMLDARDINLHGRARCIFPGVIVIGLGGSTPTPFGTPSEFSEERLAAWLAEGRAEALHLEADWRAQSGGKKAVVALVSHTPPLATACDRLSSGAPAGSRAVRAFVEEYQPALCLCGHIHEARGEDAIGATRIINPGTLASGGYVVLRMRPGADGPELEAELKTLASRTGSV